MTTATSPPGRILPLIDLTSLGEADQPDDIDRLCDAAVTPYGAVAAVCVWPRFVAQAVERLADSAVAVAAVANFPDGAADPERAVDDAHRILAGGATEVDVVLPWRAIVDSDLDTAAAVVTAARQVVEPPGVLKVILETGELADERLIRSAAEVAMASGADFLKTSTGKTPRSATPEAATVLLDVLAEAGTGGLKVSGGIRTVDQATVYLDLADERLGPAWVSPARFRFGASGLLDDVLAELEAGR